MPATWPQSAELWGCSVLAQGPPVPSVDRQDCRGTEHKWLGICLFFLPLGTGGCHHICSANSDPPSRILGQMVLVLLSQCLGFCLK